MYIATLPPTGAKESVFQARAAKMSAVRNSRGMIQKPIGKTSMNKLHLSRKKAAATTSYYHDSAAARLLSSMFLLFP